MRQRTRLSDEEKEPDTGPVLDVGDSSIEVERAGTEAAPPKPAAPPEAELPPD